MIDTAKQSDGIKKDKVLRHFPMLLHRWHGGGASLYDLTESHQSISIKVKSKNNKSKYLVLACLGPLKMSGYFQWDNSKLEVKRISSGNFEVYDEVNDFSLVCEMVEVKE